MNEHRRGALAVASALIGTLAITSGCVTEQSPRHRDVPPPPSDARVGAVQVFAAAPRDTNANGYGDTISVTVYLWAERYMLPISVEGTLGFVLKTSQGERIASWAFTPAETTRALQMMAPGPAYRFDLSLLDHGSDVLDGREALLSAEFAPKDGEPVSSAGGVALRLGKISP